MHKKRGTTTPESVAGSQGTTREVLLGPADGMPNFFLRKFRMAPGTGMPLHSNDVEHEQYVLAGRARIRVGEEVHEVGPGDALYIPAGALHDYQTLGAEPFEFLCVVPNRPDRVRFAEGAGC
ncbi:MAG: cupin domain-containing protein [Planctomycetes bacterium]|nr:cupin domain-containing protein [Planctomycetota bacterium]